MTINFKKFFNCFIIGNFSLRVSLAKLSCFKEKHLPAATLRNWCLKKVYLQSTTLLKGRLLHNCFLANLAKS